jgi:uncharacterized phage protein gp47/JayE
MAIIIKTPRQVAQEYLDNLKALRPEINTDQSDSDWWIRSRVVGGVVAGVYADLNRVSNDAFPQSARREAVNKHLEVYFGTGLRSAQAAVGNIAVTGTSGTTVAANTQFIHSSTSNIYVATSTVILSTATGSIPVQSVAVGQNQNLLTGTTLALSTPIFGLQNTATVLTPGITDGSNDESTQDGANRVLARIRNPSRGGTVADYENWSIAADPSVVSAKVNRHIYGLGTVQLIISAGTNDIDAAIDQGLPIIVQPSTELKEIVRVYVEGVNPINDVVYVDGPTELPIDITCKVAFMSGDKGTIVPGLNLTQGEILTREIKRAIYKTPIGGRLIGIISALRAADIEEQIDYNLSAAPYTLGLNYQIVGDRQITIAGGNPNLPMNSNEVAVPNLITIEAL